MIIAIDARMILPGSMHGIARYVFNLLECLRGDSGGHEFKILVNADSPLFENDWPAYMELVTIKSSWISLQEQWELPRKLVEIKANLLHAPSYIAPIRCPCKLVMTIHDLIHMVMPHFYTPLHQFYYQFIVKSCIKRSEQILTVSNFSKREIIRNLQVAPEKISVTYNGVSPKYKRVTDQLELDYVRDLYAIPDNFIFCLSNDKPHKNVRQLVRAYCDSTVDIPLILATPADRKILEIAEKFDKKHMIYFSPFIEEEHLPHFYSMANLFVYPSTYEGFGLPPLEALACGCPVVVANSSSLPEVVGDHAIFADPFDYKDIARSLERGLRERHQQVGQMPARIEHAHSYTWKKMTDLTLEVYEQCLRADHVGLEKCESV